MVNIFFLPYSTDVLLNTRHLVNHEEDRTMSSASIRGRVGCLDSIQWRRRNIHLKDASNNISRDQHVSKLDARDAVLILRQRLFTSIVQAVLDMINLFFLLARCMVLLVL